MAISLPFSSSIKPKLQKQRKAIVDKLSEVAANSPRLASLYYAFLSKDFDREHQAVLRGKRKHVEYADRNQSNRYLLRRNTHRLEKGLLMRPRRDVFGLDYIAETVQAYRLGVTASSLSAAQLDELKWSHDVLEQYFGVVAPHPLVDSLRQEFQRLSFPTVGTTPYVPYKRDLTQDCSVSYNDLVQLSYRRRSVRWFLDQPVPRELIDQAITVAALAPSACNRQPFEFRIFDDPELVQKVAATPMGTKGFSHNFPVIVVLVGKLSAYPYERDRHVIYIDSSLAAMSFMYALETLGLSSCPINWPDIEHLEVKMANLLRLEVDERPIMLIALGYPDPDGMVAYSQKKSLDELRRFN